MKVLFAKVFKTLYFESRFLKGAVGRERKRLRNSTNINLFLKAWLQAY